MIAERIQFHGQSGTINAFLQTPSQKPSKLAVVLPGAGYSCRQPLLHFAIEIMLCKGLQVLALDKIYADDPAWSVHMSEEEALKIVENDAVAVFDQIAARFTRTPDVLFGRSLGTYAMACVLEKKLVHPQKIIWQTPALRNKWSTIRDCNIPGFSIIGTADPRYKECLPYLSKEKIIIEGADHGMEIPDDPLRSIEILKQVTQATNDWL